MSNIDWGAVLHWILSYLAVSWIFFIAAVAVLMRFMRYGGMRRSWRNQDSGAFWFWAILLFAIAGVMGFIALEAIQMHGLANYH